MKSNCKRIEKKQRRQTLEACRQHLPSSLFLLPTHALTRRLISRAGTQTHTQRKDGVDLSIFVVVFVFSATARAAHIDSSAPLACLQVLQSAVTLASMPAEGVCQIMKGMVATQGQRLTAAMQALRALRDTMDEVLEDGGSNEGERKRKRVTACPDDNERQSADSTITTFTADRFAAYTRVLQDPHLLTPIVGWLFHEQHTGSSRTALGQTALVSKDWTYISRQTCFWQPILQELRPVVGDNDESLVQGRGMRVTLLFSATTANAWWRSRC